MNFDFRPLVSFLVRHTAGDRDMRVKVTKLQKSYDRRLVDAN